MRLEVESRSPSTLTPLHPDTRVSRDHPRSLFDPAPGLIYLDAATYGLPPRPSVEALTRALARWQRGEADWIEEWDRTGEACRQHFADLIGGDVEEISLVPTVSAGVGLIAASLPEGIEILLPEDEFPSVLMPLLVAERARGARSRRVAFADLAEAIGPETGLVAFSLTRAQDGATAALGDIVVAARRHGTELLVDATHAIPFVSVQPWIAEIDFLVCHGYKHLLCPRGVGFLHVHRRRWDRVQPWFANWRTGATLYDGDAYGGTLRDLAADARRFDLSLAWHAWAGAEPTLRLLVEWRESGVLEGVVALSRRLAHAIGRPDPASSIVSLRVENADAAERELAEAGVRCASRGGNIRLAPHVYTTEDDIDRAAEALDRFIA